MISLRSPPYYSARVCCCRHGGHPSRWPQLQCVSETFGTAPADSRAAVALMSNPLVVLIPHRLGREEALRRVKRGLGHVGTNFGHLFSIQEEIWINNHLQFRISALGQTASGSIDVADDHARLEVFLPWLLTRLVETLRPLIRREGTLMLEK